MTAMSTLRAIVANPQFVRPDVEPPADRHPTNNLCRDLPARLVQQIEPTPLIGHGPIRSAQGRLPEDERDWPIWVRVASHIGLALMLIATCALWSCDPMGAAAGCGPNVCAMLLEGE